MTPAFSRRRTRFRIRFLSTVLCASASLTTLSQGADEAGKSAAGNAAAAATREPPAAAKDNSDIWNAVGAVAGMISAIYAAVAARQSKRAAQESEKAASDSQRSTQALALVQLWNDMVALEYFSDTDLLQLTDRQFAERVRRQVNRLGKIAFYWSEQMVDRAALERQLNDAPILIYDQIKSIGRLQALDRTGAELLAENKGIEPLIVALKLRFRKK